MNKLIPSTLVFAVCFSTIAFADSVEVQKHCYAETQDAVISAISKDPVLGKDLKFVTVMKMQLVSNEGKDRIEVIARSSGPVSGDAVAVKNTTTKWDVYSLPSACDLTAPILTNVESVIARP